ncbi:AAA family ATPase [uncultured Cetobacterium sp.]|uniref:AAA family ATPase n=1 Tax=uncultured Cetobacterium sp. TaxID=527638 RepID=UPI0026088CD7|nr:AAA family ATPase [uncultured Cetobacterium sp.]
MKEYSLIGYKLIDDFKFNLNKINIIVGENSSGKSSFLRSFQLLKQSMYFSLENLNTNLKEGIDFGSYSNLVKNGSGEHIQFKIVFNDSIQSYGNFFIKGVEWEYRKNNLTRIKVNLEDTYIEVLLSNKKVKQVFFFNKELKIFEDNIVKYHPGKCFPVISSFIQNSIYSRISSAVENNLLDKNKVMDLVMFFFRNEELMKLNNKLEFEIFSQDEKRIKDTKKMIQNFNQLEEFKNSEIEFMVDKILEDAGKELKRKFGTVIYTGAIRATGERYYRIMESEYSEVECTVNNDVSKKLYNLKLKDSNNLELFNKFIKEHFGFRVNIETLKSNDEEIFFYVEIEENNMKNNLVDVGAGYSQILPILYAFFGKGRNNFATIIIEQPELHLHPKMQSDLLDLILKLSKVNPNLKIIIETHSPLLIDRIGKHIYKKNYQNKDINVFIFNKKEDNLEIKKTEFNEQGLLKEWPIRFFSAKELKEWS